MIISFSKVKYRPFFLMRILIILILSLNAINFSYSQTMPVPENIQAALLPKVLKFSPTLSQKAKLKMLIVYDNNSQVSKDELIKGISSIMDVKAIRPEELPQYITNADLVYFMVGLQKSVEICKTYKVLSVTGISQYVEQGNISLGFGLQNNKPKIYVNLSSLGKEGQSLSSEILRIAKVYN